MLVPWDEAPDDGTGVVDRLRGAGDTVRDIRLGKRRPEGVLEPAFPRRTVEPAEALLTQRVGVRDRDPDPSLFWRICRAVCGKGSLETTRAAITALTALRRRLKSSSSSATRSSWATIDCRARSASQSATCGPAVTRFTCCLSGRRRGSPVSGETSALKNAQDCADSTFHWSMFSASRRKASSKPAILWGKRPPPAHSAIYA